MLTVDAALSEHPLATHAVGETVGQLLERGGPRPDLVTVFVTEPHLGGLDDVLSAVRHLLEPTVLLGASTRSVLGGGREVEDHAAFVVQAIWSDGAKVRPIRIDTVPGADGPRLRGLSALDGAVGTFVLLSDPFSLSAELAVGDLAVRAPGLAVIGGAASAARRPGGNRLLLDAAVHDHGAVGALIDPSVPLATVVAQGSRPVGDPFTVTRAERNRLIELGGRPAFERLRELLDALDERERTLATDGLQIGRAVDERHAELRSGDFLVRSVLGADRELGALAVGDEIPVGTTVQFQVRDPDAAVAELARSLHGLRAAGALCFVDVDRASSFHGEVDRNATVLSESLPGAAIAGAFCSGTIGPVGAVPALHDGAVSVALFGCEPIGW